MLYLFCMPKKLVYGATKSFISFFTKTLADDLKEENVYVSLLCPGGMNTNLALTLMNKTGNFIARLSIMNPEDVGRIAVRDLLRKKELIIPGRLNQCFLVMEKILPSFLKKTLTRYSMKGMKAQNHLSMHLASAAAPGSAYQRA